MRIKTRLFDEIDIADDKILYFENGIIGLENLKRFALVFDSEKENSNTITWLQSIDEGDFAMPVINPNYLIKDYNPEVEDEYLEQLGEFGQEDLVLFTTLSVPSDISKMTANLKAPIIVNSATKKACQIVVQNEEYMVKHPVYEALLAAKERAGE